MPRPVADAALEGLEASAPGLAKTWLLDLLDATPLSAAGEVPVAQIAADGPALCAALVAALRSDEGLDALLADVAPPLLAGPQARLSAALAPTGAVDAIEALRGVVWRAVLDLAPRDAALLGDASDRLAHVCAQLAALALGELREREPAAPVAAPAPAAGDELARARAERTGDAPLWTAELQRHITGAASGGGRFALLYAEVDDAERLRAAEGDEVADGVFDRVAKAIRGELRRADVMAHEGNGRVIVIVPESGRGAATGLAARIAAAAKGTGTVRGAPLSLSVGVAVFPEDGRDGAALAGVAEEAMFAARAAGVPVEGSSS